MSVSTESPSSKAAPKGKHQTRKGRGCNQCVYMSGSNLSICTRAVKSTSGLTSRALSLSLALTLSHSLTLSLSLTHSHTLETH